MITGTQLNTYSILVTISIISGGSGTNITFRMKHKRLNRMSETKRNTNDWIDWIKASNEWNETKNKRLNRSIEWVKRNETRTIESNQNVYNTAIAWSKDDKIGNDNDNAVIRGRYDKTILKVLSQKLNEMHTVFVKWKRKRCDKPFDWDVNDVMNEWNGTEYFQYIQ